MLLWKEDMADEVDDINIDADIDQLAGDGLHDNKVPSK